MSLSSSSLEKLLFRFSHERLPQRYYVVVSRSMSALVFLAGSSFHHESYGVTLL